MVNMTSQKKKKGINPVFFPLRMGSRTRGSNCTARYFSKVKFPDNDEL